MQYSDWPLEIEHAHAELKKFVSFPFHLGLADS